MTVEEIAVIIAESHKRVNDLSYIEILKDSVKSWRNTIIRQTLQSNPEERNYFIMDCTYELESVPSYKGLYDEGKIILRTKDDVIRPLRIGEFDFVGSVDYAFPFGKADSGAIGLLLENRRDKRGCYYHYRDNRIYIYGATDIPSIGMMYIPESPEALISYRDNIPLKDVRYDITDDIATKIMQAIQAEARKALPKVNNPEQTEINENV